jgi:hypothetical protein
VDNRDQPAIPVPGLRSRPDLFANSISIFFLLGPRVCPLTQLLPVLGLLIEHRLNIYVVIIR